MRNLLLLALLLVGLAVPQSAAAYSYPGERPVTGSPATALAVATRFWDARGVFGGVPALYSAPSLVDPVNGVAAAGRALSGKVWVLSAFVKSPYKDARAAFCMVLVHEVGHVRGLPHSATGVMAPATTAVPWVCKVWARTRPAAHKLQVEHG